MTILYAQNEFLPLSRFFELILCVQINLIIFVYMKKKTPSINSYEFKVWRDGFIKYHTEAACSFNDQDIYDIFIMNH